MKKILIIIIALLTINNTVFAQSTIKDEKTNEEEIKKIRETIQQKVSEKLQIMEEKTINKKMSILGTITKIDNDIITIERKNTARSIKINEETTIINLKKTATKAQDLIVGQDIIAMGYKNENQIIETKRIVFVEKKDIKIEKLVTVGKVVDVSQTSPVFVLIPNKNKDTQYQITIDSKATTIVNKESQKITNKEIKAGSKLIVSLLPNPENNKIYNAKYIIVLN